VDGTGSESCPVVAFGISGVEPLGLATTLLVILFVCFWLVGWLVCLFVGS
jgi:hypothetical protein